MGLKLKIKEIQTGFQGDVATYNGVISKTLFMFLLLFISVFVTYNSITPTLLIPTLLVGSILSLLLIFISPNLIKDKYKAVPFAILEGVVLGCITYVVEKKVPGSGVKALTATLLSFILVYGLFATKLIKVTPKMLKLTGYGLCFSIVTLAIILICLFFKIVAISPILLLFLFLFILLLGFTSLLIDFHYIFEAVESKVKKEEEWFLAISLILSIILIYQSFLSIDNILD